MDAGITTTAAGGDPAPLRPTPPRQRPAESSSSWRVTDRIGLAFAWLLGVLFCAVAVAIVVYLAVQGIHYLRPDLLWTNPKTANTEAGSGGFLDPIIGTFLIAGLGTAIAAPLGVSVAVWLVEYSRPRALARVVESTVEMFAGVPSVVLALFGLLLSSGARDPRLPVDRPPATAIVYGILVLRGRHRSSRWSRSRTSSPPSREGLQVDPQPRARGLVCRRQDARSTTIRRVVAAGRAAVGDHRLRCSGSVTSIGDTAIILTTRSERPRRFQPASAHVPILGTLFRGTGSTLTSYVYNNAPTGDRQPHRTRRTRRRSCCC